MPISFNGNSPQNVTFNGNQVDKVIFDGHEVWNRAYTVTYSGISANSTNHKGTELNIQGVGYVSGSSSRQLARGNKITLYCGAPTDANSRFEGKIYLNGSLVKSYSGYGTQSGYGENCMYSYTPTSNVSVSATIVKETLSGYYTSYYHSTMRITTT